MREPFRWLSAALFLALVAAVFWGAQQRRELLRERLLAAAEAAAAPLPPAPAAAPDEPPAPRSLFGRRAVPSADVVDKFNAAVDRDPLWDPFYRKLQRRRVLARDNIALSALGIPVAKRAALADLLVERAVTERYVVHHLREGGRKFNSPEALATIAHATDEVDARISALIGGEAARKLKEWNTAIYSYGNAPDGPVAQDAITLREAGFELSTDQMVRLALIRYEVYALHADPGSSAASRIDPKTGLTPMEAQLFVREAEVLSPTEIATLRNWSIEEHRARAALAAVRDRFHLAPERPVQR